MDTEWTHEMLIRFIRRMLSEHELSYRDFTEITSKYVPGGISRQSLTNWVSGKYMPNMTYMAMIYFQADPAEWLFDFARKVMQAVVNIKINEEE